MHETCCSFNNSLVFWEINTLISRKHISNNKMSQGQSMYSNYTPRV